MQISDFKTGDIYLTMNKKSFVSRTIVKVMKHWAKKKDIGYDFILSHAATMCNISGINYAYGSIDSGYKPWEFDRHYDLNDLNKPCAVLRRIRPLSIDEQNKTIRYCQRLTTLSLLYQYWALIMWLLLAYLNINLFQKDSEAFTYCYEAAYKSMKIIDIENTSQDHLVDFFMIRFYPGYEIVYKNL